MAHTKAGGTARNLTDSGPKYLGVKLYQGESAQPGSVIIRSAERISFGKNTILGKIHTIYQWLRERLISKTSGTLISTAIRGEKIVSVKKIKNPAARSGFDFCENRFFFTVKGAIVSSCFFSGSFFRLEMHLLPEVSGAHAAINGDFRQNFRDIFFGLPLKRLDNQTNFGNVSSSPCPPENHRVKKHAGIHSSAVFF